MKNIFNWGIRTRLIFIAVMPVALMFCAILFYSYFSRSTDARLELNMRGSVIASILAHSSEYAVVSGNTSDLERVMHHLLASDKSIAAIAVFDKKKNLLIQFPSTLGLNNKHRIFEEPIKRGPLAVNSFYMDDLPHLSSPEIVSTSPSTDIVGYIRVTMSPVIAMARQRHQIFIESVTAAVTLLIAATLGLLLALRLIKPLTRTIGVVRQIRSGNYEVSLDITDGGEISELQSAVNEMAASLHQYKNDMEGKIRTRTVALQAAHDAAIKADAEKSRLIQSANSAVEQERKSIAIDIHDHLNAALIVTKLEAQRILAITYRCPCSTGEEINEKAHSIIQKTADLYNMARDIVKRLRPEVIDTLGLRDAIEDMIQYYDANQTQCHFSSSTIGSFDHIKSELAISVYRLVQEALSNVVKHSYATRCLVNLYILQKDELKIEVIDNGRGFNVNDIEYGIGLLGMRERAVGSGGQMEIIAAPNEGTRITVILPAPKI